MLAEALFVMNFPNSDFVKCPFSSVYYD